ncbi:hypothetical protein FA15DRAFT_654675 [Coprinopsis marcescibilis]|nr:hypothetical protein FA15DRAFT_654675 [Coprinopsis marcescibilis]
MDTDPPLDPVPEPFRMILLSPEYILFASAQHGADEDEPVRVGLPSTEEILAATAAQHEADENELVTNVDRETGIVCDEPIKGGGIGVQDHINRRHSHDKECRWELRPDNEEEEYATPCMDVKLASMSANGQHVFRKKHALRGYYVSDDNVEYGIKSITCGGCRKKLLQYVGGLKRLISKHARGNARCIAYDTELKRLREKRETDNAIMRFIMRP